MISGTGPTLLDKRDRSYHRSFGTISYELDNIEYNYDAGLTIPDQMADGFPFGCTGYTQAEVAGDEDKSVYSPAYVYQKTCDFEGHPANQGCDIRNAAKVGIVYGMKRPGEDDNTALNHRRGPFYSVDHLEGYDWFDSFRAALRNGRRPISIGTIWFKEWGKPQNGILTSFAYDGNRGNYPWHNYKICGEKIINEQPYLIAKTWQGRGYGDNGWCYIPRDVFNKAFDIYGTIGIIQPPFAPKDVFTIKLTILQFALLYLGRLIGLKAYA